MATVRVQRSHCLPAERVRVRAESVARRIEARHAVRWSWVGDVLELIAPSGPASGTRGRVLIGERDVAIEVTLPWMLSPMRTVVERRLAAKLDDWLGD